MQDDIIELSLANLVGLLFVAASGALCCHTLGVARPLHLLCAVCCA
jgi:hypothetical protein